MHRYGDGVQIISALFAENIDLRQVDGPSTRIDLTGIMFSFASATPAPVTVEPHLIALIHCPPDGDGSGVFEVTVTRDPDPATVTAADPIARNVAPFTVEPGRFTYRLVRAEIVFDEPGTVYAHCRIGHGAVTTVPLTLLDTATS